MNLDQEKFALIEKIVSLQDAQLVLHLRQIVDEQTQSAPTHSPRKAGFAKGTFPFVADDFDDILPPGFEEYVRQPSSGSSPQ
jgi:hypothetical protein